MISWEGPTVVKLPKNIASCMLNLRIETKRLKKTNPEYAGIDSVTCFGYTGYRNAKFGQIQVHKRITETSRGFYCDGCEYSYLL